MGDYLSLAKSLVKRLEGCRLVGYPDGGGKPTNGYGHTGREVQIGVTITQEIADHDLDVDLAIADGRLAEACRVSALSELHDHQRAALVCFVFNVGEEPQWSIWKDINDGNLADVPAQLRRFTKEHKGGQLVEVPGLEHRREAEIIFWNTADENAAVAVTQTANAVPAPPSGYTRDAVTPPKPLPAPPAAPVSLSAKIGTVVAGGGALLAQAAHHLGDTATQINSVVSPHADAAPWLSTAAAVLTTVVVVCGCVGVLIHVNQAQARAT